MLKEDFIMNNYYNNYEYPYQKEYKNEYQNEYQIPAIESYSEYKKPTTGNYYAHEVKSNLFNPYDGFIRGNLFPNLYDPYIEEEPYGLSPENDQEAMLNKVREQCFAMIDLDLYLDTHPEDSEKIKLYNQYSDYASIAKSDYARKYGPLTLNSEALNAYPWAWLQNPWPWEVK